MDTMDTKKEGVFWVKIPVSLIRGSGLSAEARALMCYCLSHAKGRWQIRPNVVNTEFGWSPRTRQRVFAECEQAGYLTGTVRYDKQKRQGIDFEAHEEPVPENERTHIYNWSDKSTDLKSANLNGSKIDSLKSAQHKIDQEEEVRSINKIEQEEPPVGALPENVRTLVGSALTEYLLWYKEKYGISYERKPSDTPALGHLIKRLGDEFQLREWHKACRFYMASSMQSHTLTYLATHYPTFKLAPIDRFGKPDWNHSLVERLQYT